MKYSIILFLTILFFACSQKSEHVDISTVRKPDDWTLKQNILKGDTAAYLELYNRYYQRDNAVEFFPWAIIMANKHNYKRAFRDAYACLLETNNYFGKWDSLTSKKSNLLDTTTMNLAKAMLYKTFDTFQINNELRSSDRSYKIEK